MVAPVCRHCRKRKARYARGICWTCFRVAGVKERYGPTTRDGRRGVSNDNVNGLPLPEPTTALPGTVQKTDVLAFRAAWGLALWHPLDARGDDDRLPLRALVRLRRIA